MQIFDLNHGQGGLARHARSDHAPLLLVSVCLSPHSTPEGVISIHTVGVNRLFSKYGCMNFAYFRWCGPRQTLMLDLVYLESALGSPHLLVRSGLCLCFGGWENPDVSSRTAFVLLWTNRPRRRRGCQMSLFGWVSVHMDHDHGDRSWETSHWEYSFGFWLLCTTGTMLQPPSRDCDVIDDDGCSCL
jgi:hypothetical protein